jgi:hypothetical protein
MGPQIELKAAISISFNFTQWANIQNQKSAQCLVPIHPSSEQNLLKSGGFLLSLGFALVAALSVFII